MNLLRNLTIEKVAFVDVPANPDAEILIWKAAEPPADKEPRVADDKKTEDVEKALAEKVLRLETDLASATETLQALEAMDNETLAALRGIEVAKRDETEDVLKGLPAEVRERIEKAETRIAQMEHSARVEQFVKAAAQDFGDLAPAEALGKALEVIDRSAPEAAKVVTQVLKAAAARTDTAALFEELGGDPQPISKTDLALQEIHKRVAAGAQLVEAQRAVFAEHPEWLPETPTV